MWPDEKVLVEGELMKVKGSKFVGCMKPDWVAQVPAVQPEMPMGMTTS